MLRFASLCLLAAAAFAAGLSEQYRAVADRLIDAALSDTEGYDRLAYLCYRIGHRLSGSAGLEKAVAWSAEEMKRAGLSNVRTIPVKVPHWERGAESARMVAPRELPLHMLGLGMSVATPPEGVTAEVVVVSTFEELAALGRSKIAGKMVLFNAEYRGYNVSRLIRTAGPSRAAALGAVAALVRSVTPLAMQIPHTGAVNYEENQPKIPAAAISPEDAMMIARLSAEGPVKVTLQMGARMLPDADSANVIGEIPGKELPEEVVVLGGHLDSWDVGQGAQDDGAAVIASLQALALMKKLGIEPRRTIRVAFWVNEENGARGGVAYREWVGDKIANHVAAIEMDGGAEAPIGFGAAVDPASMELLKDAARLLGRVGATQILQGGGGADIAPLIKDGVPGILSEFTTGINYFNWHHTIADTLDKVNPDEFRRNVAALAVMSYVLADMPGRLTPVAPRSGGQ